MTPKEIKMLAEMEQRWKGKKVKIIDAKHPWYDHKGKVKSIDKTHSAGWGMLIKLENGFTTYIFKKEQIEAI